MGAKSVVGKTVRSVWTESAQMSRKVCHSAWEIVNGNACGCRCECLMMQFSYHMRYVQLLGFLLISRFN